MIFRYLLSAFGILLALPILGLITMAFWLPITVSGMGYLLACTLAVVGFIIAPWRGRLSFLLVLIGGVVFVFVAGTRLVLAAREGNSNIKVLTLPQGTSARWATALIDEQNSLIFGEAIFHRIGGDSRREHARITDALHDTYLEMRGTEQGFASPVLNTYLGLQRSAAFDTVIVDPEINRHPDLAVIFLHGYMGNVTAQCWEIAQAVEKIGAITVCPSTDWTGQWWRPEGQAILLTTFRYLREQGIQRFYVGGFSNGGFSISRLASTITEENGLKGLFFINGISNGASIRESGIPVLILQGAQDERVPAAGVRSIAEIVGDLGTYIEIEGDHFMIIKQPQQVQKAIRTWLEKQGE